MGLILSSSLALEKGDKRGNPSPKGNYLFQFRSIVTNMICNYNLAC